MSNKRILKDDEHWTPPTPEEVAYEVDKIGGINKVASILKKNRATVMRWVKGEFAIDFANWEHMKSNRRLKLVSLKCGTVGRAIAIDGKYATIELHDENGTVRYAIGEILVEVK